MKKLTLLFGILLLGISCTLNQNASCQKASKEMIIELLSISEKHTAEGMVAQMSALNDQIEQFIQMVNPEATQEQITAKSKDFIENNQMMKVMIDVLSDYYTDLTEAEVDVL